MDYQNWTKDELEIKLLELEEEMNIVKDENRLNNIISEINQIEKIMDLKKISILKANLNKTAKRFGYTWDKHKSQWKLNSKDEIEQDESATEKLGMRKKSSYGTEYIRYDIRNGLTDEQIAKKINERYEDISYETGLEIAKSIRETGIFDWRKLNFKKKSHKLDEKEINIFKQAIQSALKSFENYVKTDELESITKCKITLMNLVRDVEKIENDDKKSKENGI